MTQDQRAGTQKCFNLMQQEENLNYYCFIFIYEELMNIMYIGGLAVLVRSVSIDIWIYSRYSIIVASIKKL